MNGRINPTELVKDEREVARILNNKLIIPLASPRAFKSMIRNCKTIIENANK